MPACSIFGKAIFLPIIIFLGIITSIGDIKYSKIKNNYIAFGLFYSIIIYMLAWALYFYSLNAILPGALLNLVNCLIWNFDKWCINLTVSALVAYSFWHYKIWGAGDAKLFICFSALIPMSEYTHVFFKYHFASFLLLIYIFVPSSLLLVFKSIAFFLSKNNFPKFKLSLPVLIKNFISKNNILKLVKILYGFFGFFLIYQLMKLEFFNFLHKLILGQNIIILMFFLLFKKLTVFFQKYYNIVSVILISLVLFIIFKKIIIFEKMASFIKNSIRQTVFIILLIPAINKIVELYIDRLKNKYMPFAPWIFLGTLLVWVLKLNPQ